MKTFFAIPFLFASLLPAHAEDKTDYVADATVSFELAQNADCYSVGQNVASQNGGTLSAASEAVQNGENVCRIIVVVPAQNGERPKRLEVIVPN